MNIDNLLKCGYFPKELPPAFSTETFAANIASIKAKWNLIDSNPFPHIEYSSLLEFTIPKKNYVRRKLSIPNPICQYYLSKYILDNWSDIETHCMKSNLTASRPIENDFSDKDNKRAFKTLKTFFEFKKDCIIESYDRLFELKTDISWFYPSIYTHSIPWALHTKEVSKANRGLNYYGNVLDKYLRYCQSGQTNGIPTGPDTSLVIAEIILCSIDEKLQQEFNNLKGYRYYDDYYFYLSNKDEAYKVLKYLQFLLNDLQLSLNEEKSTIKKYPMPYDDEWVLPLSTFNLSDEVEEQGKDIWKYFNLAFELFDKYKNDPVLKYAINRVRSHEIHDENWILFESLLFKCTLLDARTIEPVIQFLLYYETSRNPAKIEKIVHELLEQHVSKNHTYEILWTLWFAKSFNVNIPNDLAEIIFHSNDVLSIIIALDLKAEGLINPSLDTSFLITDLTSNSLYQSRWILTYEAIVKNWLTPQDSSLLDNDAYFKALKEDSVVFYDGTKQLDPIEITDNTSTTATGKY
jgi:hypothetical protein